MAITVNKNPMDPPQTIGHRAAHHLFLSLLGLVLGLGEPPQEPSHLVFEVFFVGVEKQGIETEKNIH